MLELLIVVLIVGVLAAVAVPQYQVTVWKSRYATLKNLTHDIARAEEIYYLGNGDYTTEFTELDIQPPGSCEGGSCYFDDRTKYCFVGHTDAQSTVQCTLLKDGKFLVYRVFLKRSKALPEKRECISYQTTDYSAVQSRVCKSETGLTTSSSSSSGDTPSATYRKWNYPN